MYRFLILLLVSGAAQAEVYRCSQNGQTVYTDRPCAEDAQPQDLPKLNVVPPSELERRLAGEYDATTARDKAARDKANRDWLKRRDAQAAESQRLSAARREGRVSVGMSASQVRELYGEPDTLKKSERKGVLKETWVFHRNGGVQTVELQDGRVRHISEKKSRKK